METEQIRRRSSRGHGVKKSFLFCLGIEGSREHLYLGSSDPVGKKIRHEGEGGAEPVWVSKEYTFLILALGELRLEDYQFKSQPGLALRPFLPSSKLHTFENSFPQRC